MIIGQGVSVGGGIYVDVKSDNFPPQGVNKLYYGDLGNLFDASTYSGSGNQWVDTQGGNVATLINSPTYSTDFTGYFEFNGTNQRATVSGTPLNPTSYTKCVWFYLNGTQSNHLISFNDGTGTGHYMAFNNTNKLYCGHASWPGFPLSFESVTTFDNFVWYFVALTFDTTSGMTLFVNGREDSKYTLYKTPPVASQIGIASYDTFGYFKGRIGRVYIYNRALTAEEVRWTFNGTRYIYSI